MEFLFDTANLEDIRKYIEIYPVTGITSNPSILKAEGEIDFFTHMRAIRQLIGERMLHIQVTAQDCEGMIKDAQAILKNVDDRIFIKIPTTEEGLKAMRILKAEGVGVTATAIYTKIQGFMAIACGVDFIAPYYNRMENLDIDSCETIASFRQMIDEDGAETKILAASFKNIAQVNQAILAGAHTATLAPSLLHEAFGGAAIQKAAEDFHNDWVKIHGNSMISDLV